MQEEEVYRSRVSVSYYFAMVFLVFLGAVAIYLYFDLSDYSGAVVLLPLAAMCFLIVLLIIWFAFFMLKYVLKENSLLIRGYLAKTEIAYSSVREIRETSSLYAFYMGFTTLSLDQIYIGYDVKGGIKLGKNAYVGRIIISPVRKEEFMTKLSARCGIDDSSVGRETKETKEMRRWAYTSAGTELVLAIVVIAVLIRNGIDYWGSTVGLAIVVTFCITLFTGLTFCKRLEKTENASKLGKYKIIQVLLTLITFAVLILITIILLHNEV